VQQHGLIVFFLAALARMKSYRCTVSFIESSTSKLAIDHADSAAAAFVVTK
jgi:hypothetical protein